MFWIFLIILLAGILYMSYMLFGIFMFIFTALLVLNANETGNWVNYVWAVFTLGIACGVLNINNDN